MGCMMRFCGCLSFGWSGNLNDRSIPGLRCVNANNGVSRTRWNNLLRHSEINMSKIFLHHAIRGFNRKLIETALQGWPGLVTRPGWLRRRVAIGHVWG